MSGTSYPIRVIFALIILWTSMNLLQQIAEGFIFDSAEEDPANSSRILYSDPPAGGPSSENRWNHCGLDPTSAEYATSVISWFGGRIGTRGQGELSG